MNPDAAIFLLLLLIVAVLVLVALLLNVVWSREQVKEDLRRQGFTPIHVRWQPFGNRAISHPATFGFEATFVDATGSVLSGRCVVHQMFHTVRWVRNDVSSPGANLSPAWQVFYLVVAGWLIWFGVKHLFTGTLWLPAHGDRWIWRGGSVMVLSLASLCGAANLLSAVAYRYVRQAHERFWTLLNRGLGFAGWLLFVASFVVALWQAVSK